MNYYYFIIKMFVIIERLLIKNFILQICKDKDEVEVWFSGLKVLIFCCY